MALDSFIQGFLGSFQAIKQQRFENDLALRRQQAEEQQFDRQMRLAQMRMDFQQQQETQQMERQARMDELGLQQAKYQAGVEAKERQTSTAIKGQELKLREQSGMREARAMQIDEERRQRENQIKGMQAYSQTRAEYDKQAKGLFELERKRGMAAGMGEQVPELDYQYMQGVQSLMGLRQRMSAIEQGLSESVATPPMEAGIPGGGEAEAPSEGEAPPEAAAPPQAAAPTAPEQQRPEAYPGERYMRGRPQPSTKAEADELEADLNAKYKEIDRPGNVQIQSLEEKNKATDVERENLLKSRTPAINSFFRLKPATMDISLGETVDSEGKPAGGAILYEGEKPLQPNNQTLDENNSVKRIDIGKSLEAYTEAVGPQPAMGRMYSAYVSAPLAERSRKLGTPVVTGEALNPKTGEMEPEYELHVELDPFEVAKQSKLGQDAVLASEANRTASFAYENYGIVPQPPPPKIVPKEYKAGELLDRVQDEIFGGGGLSPSAALSIMDQNLKPDQDDGTYSPAAQQKIQNLVNSAEKTLQEVRTTQGTIDVMSSGYLGNRGHGQRKVEAAQNVLTALQKTQQKMRTPPPGGALQAPRVPPDLKSPELQKFGGLLNLGKEPIKGKEPAAPEKQREDLPKRGGPFFGTGVGKAEPSRGSPSGVIGMRGALTLAAIGGQTEVNSFNSAFSSVQKAKDRNAAAKSAAGDLKSAWGGMTDKEKEAARSQWTTKKTQWKQWKVDEKYINEVDAFINPKKK